MVIVEWPDRLKLRTDWPVVRIQLEHVAEDTRRISVEGYALKNRGSSGILASLGMTARNSCNIISKRARDLDPMMWNPAST